MTLNSEQFKGHHPLNTIQKGLGEHKKTIGMEMFLAGLQHMGVDPSPKNLSTIAQTYSEQPEMFHQLVSRARSQAIGARQRVKEMRRGRMQ